MNTKKYKKEKLIEIKEYKNILYDNYKDQVKTINTYVFGLSSTALFAIYGYILNVELPLEFLNNIKFISLLLFLSLIFMILVNIFYSIDSIECERNYSELYNSLLSCDDEKEINNKIEENYNKIFNAKRYIFFSIIRYLSYIFLLAAICIMTFSIFTFESIN